MSIFRGPDSTPELQSLAPDDRRQIWKQYYQRSIASWRAIVFFVVYALCVLAVSMVGEALSGPSWAWIIAGNVLASTVCHAGLTVSTQKMIRERYSNTDRE